MPHRVQVGAGRGQPAAAVDVAVELREPLLPVAVDVVGQRVAGLLHGLEERAEQRVVGRAALQHQRAVAAAPVVGAGEAALHLLEVRQAVEVVPLLHPRLGAPALVVQRVAALEDHPVDRAGPAEHLAAGVEDLAVVEVRLRVGLVLPVVEPVPDRERQRRRHVDERVDPEVRAAGLEHQHRRTGVRGEPVGERAAGRATAHDDDVVPVRIRAHPAEPALLGRADVVPDVLGLAVLVEAGGPELAADAGLLEAAPLGLRHVRVVVVDPDRAHPQPGRDPLALAGVLGPDRAGQAVDRVVGDPDRLVLVAERLDGEHRPERLVLGDRHRAGAAVEDRGQVVEAVGQRRVVGPRAAAAEHGALGDPAGDVRLDLLAVGGAGERAGLGLLVERAAEPDPAGAVDQPVDELVVDVLVHDQPRAGGADLAGVQEHRGQGEVEGHLEVGVGEHQVGVLAAELEGHLLHRARRGGHQPPAGLQAAGEGDQVDPGVGAERRAGRRDRRRGRGCRRRRAGRPPRAAASGGSRCAGSARSA